MGSPAPPISRGLVCGWWYWSGVTSPAGCAGSMNSCAEYNLVVSSGAPARIISDEVCARASNDMDDEYGAAVQLSFAAWKRVLDREEPDYAN